MRQAKLKNLREVEDLKRALTRRGYSEYKIIFFATIVIHFFLADVLWLSASDIGRSAGQFYWPDATPVDVITWAPGSPNAFITGQKTCVVFDVKVGRLRDYDCAKYYHLLCELPREFKENSRERFE